MESARFARFFRRAVPRDRPAKLETRSSLGSPLYKYHTLLSASRLVAREHRGERGREGEGERERQSRLRGPLRSVPRSRGPHRPSPVLSVAPAALWTMFTFSIIYEPPSTPSFNETSIDRVSFTVFFFFLRLRFDRFLFVLSLGEIYCNIEERMFLERCSVDGRNVYLSQMRTERIPKE